MKCIEFETEKNNGEGQLKRVVYVPVDHILSVTMNPRPDPCFVFLKYDDGVPYMVSDLTAMQVCEALKNHKAGE